MSPIRRLSPQSKKRVKKGRKSDVKDAHITQNLIFICSTSPQSEEKVGQFLYGSDKEPDVSMKMLRSELLPPALLLQLEGKGIAVHWVDMQRSLGQVTSLLLCRPVASGFDGTILGLIHIEVGGLQRTPP